MGQAALVTRRGRSARAARLLACLPRSACPCIKHDGSERAGGPFGCVMEGRAPVGRAGMGEGARASPGDENTRSCEGRRNGGSLYSG